MIYNCDTCKKFFTQKSNYTAHRNKKYPCVHRETVFKTVPQMPSNILSAPQIEIPGALKIVSGPKNECKYCLKTFVRSNVFKNECKYCLKTFVRSNGLKRHLEGRCKGKNDTFAAERLNERREELEEEVEKMKQEIEKMKLAMSEQLNKDPPQIYPPVERKEKKILKLGTFQILPLYRII